ncbi:MAG: hypothetical protein MMC23_008545 [Stictis urceolatum]|nr:hypothetical protein [Stictis urceolata]
MVGTAIASHVNGFAQHVPALLPELAQYDKILSLRDEIFAGTHPRFIAGPQNPAKVPAVPAAAPAVPGLNGPVPGLSSTLPNGNAPFPISNNTTAQTTYSPGAQTPATNLPAVKPTQISQPTPFSSTPSAFDPVFLQKSDTLLAAEMKLARKRIEDSLAEQLQHNKDGARQRNSENDSLPDFDASEVLEKALEIVKPLATSDVVAANDKGSAGSESIDDNTFYSSQVNDSDGDADLHPRLRATKPCKYFFDGKCNRGDTCNFSHDPAFKKKLQHEPLTVDAEMRDAPDSNRQHRAPLANPIRRGSPDYGREEGELVEDSSYSPPNAQEPVEGQSSKRNRQNGGPRNGRQHDLYSPPRDPAPGGRRRSGRGSPVYDNQPPPQGNRRASGRASPIYDGRVVRNHITSPIAPQPARVSPLAVTKVQNLGLAAQNGPPENSNNRKNQKQSGNAQGPNPAQQPKSKKRRREQDRLDNERNVAPRRFIDSPVQAIKQEPVSPLPFHAVPASAYQQREVIRSPAPVQYVPPQTERVVYQPVREREPARERVYLDEPARTSRLASPSLRRIVSGPAGHYEAQPDLRRVVSARNLGRAMSPQQEPAYHSPSSLSGSARPTSRAYVIESSPEPPRQTYRASVQPQAVYSRPPQTSPEIHQVQYSPIEREPRTMAHPVRRIVVDKYGNQFYETPFLDREPERIGSVAPQLRPRYISDIDAPVRSLRESARPEPVGAYPQETRYVQRFSPEPTSPRYAEPQVRYEPAPRYVEYHPAPPPRISSRAPSRALSHAPTSRVEIHQDEYARPGQQRIIEIPRERREFAEDMPPPPPQVRLHSVAPSSSYQRGGYIEDYEGPGAGEPRYQPVERTRVATVQPEGGRYVIAGGYEGSARYAEEPRGRYADGGREGTIVRQVSRSDMGRAGSVLVEAPSGRRVEYVERGSHY